VSKKFEHEARESGESRPSKLKEKVLTGVIVHNALRTYTADKSLTQFTNKNITAQRKNDVSSERKGAGLERKQYRLEFKNTELRTENKAVKQELYAQIKKEYSSIENYAKEKKKPNFQKSAEHTALSLKCAESDRAVLKSDTKISHVSEKSKKLRHKRSDSLYYRAGDKGNSERSRYSAESTDKSERKAAKLENKLNRANKSRNLPQHRIIRKSYKFDSETGKVKKSLILDKQVKPIDGRGGIVTKGLKGASLVTAVRLSQSIHSQLNKGAGNDDSAKIANTGARLIEHAAVKTVKHTHKFLQERPYKKVSKLQLKSDKANAKLYAKRKGGTKKQMKKQAQKHMNRAKQARKATSVAEKLAKVLKAVGLFLKKVLLNPYVLLVLLIVFLVIFIVSLIFSLFAAVGGNSGAFFGAYLAEDEQIHAAVEYANEYSQTAVQAAIDNVISSVVHDIVYIEPYTLEFNPYALISFLSAYSFTDTGDEYDNSFNAASAGLRNAIQAFINRLYQIQYATAIYTATGTDNDGNDISVDYAVLYIVVNRRAEDETAQSVFNSGSPYDPSMYDLYLMYMETQGFRPDLFPNYTT